jgi:hypothetical protein
MTKTRCKQQMRYIYVSHRERSAVGENSFEAEHRTDFNITSTLGKAAGYTNHHTKGTTEIQIHHNNFNSNGNPTLSQARYTVTYMLQLSTEILMGNGQAKQVSIS